MTLDPSTQAHLEHVLSGSRAGPRTESEDDRAALVDEVEKIVDRSTRSLQAYAEFVDDRSFHPRLTRVRTAIQNAHTSASPESLTQLQSALRTLINLHGKGPEPVLGSEQAATDAIFKIIRRGRVSTLPSALENMLNLGVVDPDTGKVMTAWVNKLSRLGKMAQIPEEFLYPAPGEVSIPAWVSRFQSLVSNAASVHSGMADKLTAIMAKL